MNEKFQRVRMSLGGSLTPVVRTLLWFNGLAYLFLQLAGRSASYAQDIDRFLGLVPRAVIQDWAFWQPITYMFLHREFVHFLFNMLGLWWFGADVERRFGSKLFLRYYLLTGIGAGITSILLNWNSPVPTIGASGAIFGLLLAFGMLFPDRVIYLYFVIPVKAKYCVFFFALLELVALMQTSDGVNHFAHLGGMVFGLAWFGYHRTSLKFSSLWKFVQRKRMRRKLRLIRRGGDDDNQMTGYSNRTIH